MNLLAQHHRNGRRFEPLEFIEEGQLVAVKLGVSDPGWSERAETYKVFTFRDDGNEAVLLQDTTGEDHARYLLRHP